MTGMKKETFENNDDEVKTASIFARSAPLTAVVVPVQVQSK